MTARAGWFPDPAGRPDHFRWWDGSAWTRYLTTDPTAPGPGPEPPQAAGSGAYDVAGRHQATDPGPWQRAGQVVASQSPAPQSPAPQTPSGQAPSGQAPSGQAPSGPASAARPTARTATRPPGYERPEGGRHGSLRPALVGTGAVALAAVIVLAIVLFGSPRQPGLQPPPPDDSSAAGEYASPSPEPSATSSGPPVSFDPTTRVIDYDGLRITLPAAPYKITRTLATVLGESGRGVDGEALVHKNYDGKKSDWDASVVVDGVGDDLTGKTLGQTADKIMTRWETSEFGGSKTTVTNEKKSTLTKNLPRPVRVITADVHYSVKGVPSKYDHVSLLVAKGKSGGYVAFISSRPNDADAKIKKALQDSINTVGLT